RIMRSPSAMIRLPNQSSASFDKGGEADQEAGGSRAPGWRDLAPFGCRLGGLGADACVGYQARVNPACAGLPLTALVQLRCRLDHCLPKPSKADDYPEVVELHTLSGDHCTMVKVRAASMEHFEGLLERLGKHGEMRTSVVLSTQFAGRPVEAPAEDFTH